MESIPVYDLKSLGKRFNLSVRTLREYIKRKDLPASKIGRAYYVTELDVRRFLNDTEAYKFRKRWKYPYKD